MKIGLSYSRCIRDIVDGVVDIDDVLVIISRTNFDPHDDAQWKGIWEGYHWDNPEWYTYGDEDEDRFRSVSIELWESGKFHQPRKFGAHLYAVLRFGWKQSCPVQSLKLTLWPSQLGKNFKQLQD